MKPLGIVLIGVVMTLGCAPGADAPLTFGDPRVRLPVPGTDKSVGYFDVTNNTPAAITLVGAAASGVRAIEFHTVIRDGDMMRMRRLQDVEVAPGATVEFAPGGRHLMLFGVAGLGEQLEIVFTDANGAQHAQAFRTFAAISPE